MGFGVKIRRMISSTKREFQLLYNLDSIYIDAEIQHRILGNTDEVAFNKIDKKDFGKALDIIPTASPGYSSRAQLRQETLEVVELCTRMPNVGMPNPQTGQVKNQILMDQLTRKLLGTYSLGELARYIPEPPAPPLEPGVEHARWREGNIPKPTEAENQTEHISAHRIEIMANGNLYDAETRQKIQKHIHETEVMLMAKMQMQAAPPQPMEGPPQQQPPGAPGMGMESDFSGAPPMVGNA